MKFAAIKIEHTTPIDQSYFKTTFFLSLSLGDGDGNSNSKTNQRALVLESMCVQTNFK